METMNSPEEPTQSPQEQASLPASAAPGSGVRGSADGSDYGAEQIRALKGIEGIRTRPAMYIGDTGPRGLHHLVYEVVDNSIDEASNGFARQIVVRINADGSVSVADDGRGIPVGPMPDMENRSALEVVLTEIHAGAKFDRQGGYKTGTGGLHGVGITAVNALSEWLEAEIRREGAVWTMEFARGTVAEPLKKLGVSDRTGTKITFQPDPRIFPDTKFHYDTLQKRLQELAFLNKGVRIQLFDERTGAKDDFCYEDGLIEFVKHLNRTTTPLFPQVIHVQGTQDQTEVEVALQRAAGVGNVNGNIAQPHVAQTEAPHVEIVVELADHPHLGRWRGGRVLELYRVRQRLARGNKLLRALTERPLQDRLPLASLAGQELRQL